MVKKSAQSSAAQASLAQIKRIEVQARTNSRFLIRLLSQNHEYQKPGLCGPAIARLALKSALAYQVALGLIEPQTAASVTIPSQKEIAKKTFSGPKMSDDSEVWQKMKRFIPPEDMEFYERVGKKNYCLPEDLALFLGKGAEFKENATVADLLAQLAANRPVIVLWQEELPDRHDWFGGGHWSMVAGYHKSDNSLVMIDSSRSERFYDPVGRVVSRAVNPAEAKWRITNRYKIALEHFVANWFDGVEETGREYHGAMISLDLSVLNPRRWSRAMAKTNPV